MNRNKRSMTLCCVLLCLNLAFIWGNSLVPAEASDKFSHSVLSVAEEVLANPAFDGLREWLLGTLGPSEPGQESGHHLLRKAAHFTEFSCLGMLLCWLCLLKNQQGIHMFAMPLLPGVLTACIDETIQLYSPGRGPSLIDVWIDVSGVILGIILVVLGHHILKHRKK